MRVLTAVAAALALGAPTAARADSPPRKPKVGDVRKLELVGTIRPAQGFVEDAIEFDGAGGRLLYVNSDAATLCELHVVDLGQGMADLRTVDLSKITAAPREVHFALGGESFLVAYDEVGDSETKRVAALTQNGSAVRRRFGPATDVRLTRVDGQPAVVVFQQTRRRTDKGEVRMEYAVEVRALATGKRLGKATTLSTDETGYSKELDFRMHYWRDGYTRAAGVRGGEWDRKEDQRSPDASAVYDLPQRLFSRRSPIVDVTKHTKRLQLRSQYQNQDNFLLVTHDLSGLQWFRNEELIDVGLAQPFHHYDPSTLRYQAAPDGGMYFSLTIDPVNPDAVARKKADPKWLDLYVLRPGATKARRVGRVVVGQREVHWVASANYWALLPKHLGFDRGGKELLIYRPQ